MIGYDNLSERCVVHWIDVSSGRFSETPGKRVGNEIDFLRISRWSVPYKSDVGRALQPMALADDAEEYPGTMDDVADLTLNQTERD